jgi:CRP/FNR family transcriptional regulator, cyclic AMP receptor protein
MRKTLYLLGILGDSDLEWLIANGKRLFLPNRSTLFEEGSEVDFLYILLDGELSVRRRDGAPIATLWSGEAVGEISLVDSRPITATVVANRDCCLLAIGKVALKAKLEKDTQFASRFYRAIAVFLADRLRSTVRNLGYGTANEEPAADELAEDFLPQVDLAALRFDSLLRRLQAGAYA